MSAGRRAEGLRGRPEGGRAEGQGLAARARVHRGPGPALHAARPRTARARRPRLRGGHEGRGPPLPERPRRGHPVRGGAHGPAALELLDARRPALRRDPGDRGHAGEGAGPEPEPPGREPPLHPRGGGHEAPREGRGRRRPPAEADARRRPHGPHAVPHLSARGPLRRRRRLQRAGHQGRRGLHHAVPRPGPVPDGLLPPQHPFPLVRGHGRGPQPGRHRGRPQDGRADRPSRCWTRCRSRAPSRWCRITPSPGSAGGTRCWPSRPRPTGTST